MLPWNFRTIITSFTENAILLFWGLKKGKKWPKMALKRPKKHVKIKFFPKRYYRVKGFRTWQDQASCSSLWTGLWRMDLHPENEATRQKSWSEEITAKNLSLVAEYKIPKLYDINMYKSNTWHNIWCTIDHHWPLPQCCVTAFTSGWVVNSSGEVGIETPVFRVCTCVAWNYTLAFYFLRR